MAYTNQQNLDVPIPVTVSGTVTVNISGQGVFLPATQVVKISGETVVAFKGGTAFTTHSGYPTMDTVTISGFNFLEHENATIVFNHIGEGSGAAYTVYGQAKTGFGSILVGSGAVYSGTAGQVTITTPYQWVETSVKNLQAGYSGIVTVSVARR